MKYLHGGLIGLLLAAAHIGAGPVRALPSLFDEDFSTTQFKDSEMTSALWDTTAGTLTLHPFEMSVVGTADTPGTAAGVVLAGDVAYVADSYSLRTFDIRTPHTPVPLGSVPISDIQALAIDGDYLYAACGNTGFYVISVANPAAPAVAGSVASLGNVRGVTVRGNLVLLACDEAGLILVDVTDPASPQLRGQYDTPSRATWVAISGDHAFVSDGPAGLKVIDVADPLHPSLVGAVDTPNFAECVAVDGDYAFIADGQPGGLLIFDVSNPASPQLVGSHAASGGAQRVCVDGDYAFLLFSSTGGLRAIDITDPTTPTLARTLTGAGLTEGRDIALAGEWAFVADGSGGLRSIDIAFRVEPRVVGAVDLPGSSWRLDVAGNYAYVAGGFAGLQVVDISDPVHPVPAAACTLAGTAAGVATAGDLAVVTLDSWLLGTVDIHDPTHPVTLGACSVNFSGVGLALAGDLAYVAAREAGLKVVDLSSPASPSVVGGYDTPGYAWAVAIDGNRAYVADDTGLRIFDISDPDTPTLLGSILPGGEIRDVAVADNYAFLACWNHDLTVIDVSNPGSPTIAGSLATPGLATDITLRGDMAFVGSLEGLHTVDIEDPTHPLLIGSCEPAGIPANSRAYVGPVVAGDFAFTTFNNEAFRVVEVVQRRFVTTRNLGQSERVASTAHPIYWASLATSQSDSIGWWLSADDGSHWEAVVPGSAGHAFANPGLALKWRATLDYGGPATSPSCTSLQIDWLDTWPVITSVKDVPRDQGGQVRVTWERSAYDFLNSAIPITQYAIYRRIDEGLLHAPAPSARHLAGDETGGPALRTLRYPPGEWECVFYVPARTEAIYHAVVPTLGDSTITGGPYPSTFFVAALTATPGVYFDSPPDSGYSLDNTPPAVAGGFRVNYGAEGNRLNWDPSHDPDFALFRVYRSAQPVFEPAPANLVHETTGTEWWDPAGTTQSTPTMPGAQTSQPRYYQLTCVDASGNESAPVYPGTVSAVDDGAVAGRFGLLPQEPNPFTPPAAIRFELSRAGPVSLAIVDVTGRLVARLVEGWRPAGSNRIDWDGRRDDGRAAPAGVYLSLLKTGEGVRCGKLTLMR